MSFREFSDTHAVTVFYPRRRGVLVTDMWFCAHGRRYAVEELAGLGWCSGSAQVARRVALKIIAVETAVVAMIVLAAGPSLLALLVGGLYILVAGACIWFSLHHWPTPLNLCADHRGASTVLYTSTDRIEFHKVYRALRRAAEQQQLIL